MSESPRFQQVEAAIAALSLADQLLLLERLAQRIRMASPGQARPQKDEVMATMANDPDIQYELREINAEFLVAESDGLDKYQ